MNTPDQSGKLHHSLKPSEPSKPSMAKITIAISNMPLIASMIRQKRIYSRTTFDRRKRALLPYIANARSLGLRRLDDLLSVVGPMFAQDFPYRKPLTRATLQRAIKRLAELGLDPGLDDLSTARKLGRPTRRKMTDHTE